MPSGVTTGAVDVATPGGTLSSNVAFHLNLARSPRLSRAGHGRAPDSQSRVKSRQLAGRICRYGTRPKTSSLAPGSDYHR